MKTLARTTFKFVESFLSSIDTPRALSVWLLFREGEHRQIVEMDVNPADYIDYEEFRSAYISTKLLSKATFLSTNIDKKLVALDSFLDAEEACAQTNRRGYHHLTINREVGARLHNAIVRKIGSILGEFDAEEMIDSANWGPGVTLLIKGVDTSSVNKFRQEVGTTRPLDDLMGDLYAVAYPHWDLSSRKIFKGNKIVTVPKNSKTDRTIAIEPGLNLWFQKGVGKMIRRRLFRKGLDLNTQERNQHLSRYGSATDDLATVDFSAASDTIALSTVRELLPPHWFSVMDRLRSRFGLLGDKVIEYEKFSSMGNGFTFELESLIFFSIAVSVCDYLHYSSKDVSVFGDDVLLPKPCYPLFVKTCAFYGFTVNQKKSFSSGYFRESCGSHWYNGRDCKPFFLKEEIKGEHEIYKAANSVVRLSRNHSDFRDRRFYRCWRFLRKQVRNPCLISEGYGDGGFVVNFDEACPSRLRHGIEGYRAKSLIAVPKQYFSDDQAVLLARLKDRSVEMSFGNKTNLRGRVKIYRKKIFIRRWFDLGQWF